jgi:DNA-binding MurR/RpiR family transcriptional regulator
MRTEIEVPLKAALAALAVLHEYLAKGGNLAGVDDDALAEMVEALASADRIVIKGA